MVPEQLGQVFATAARKREMLRQILGARDHPRGERRRQASLLPPVKLRVLEGREALDPIQEGRGQARLLDEETLRKYDSNLGRNRVRQVDGLRSPRRRNQPGLLGVHVLGLADLESDDLPAYSAPQWPRPWRGRSAGCLRGTPTGRGMARARRRRAPCSRAASPRAEEAARSVTEGARKGEHAANELGRSPGRPGQLPARGSPRSGRARFAHPAPLVRDSLPDGTRSGWPGPVAAGIARATHGSDPTSAAISTTAAAATCTRSPPPRSGSAKSPTSSR